MIYGINKRLEKPESAVSLHKKQEGRKSIPATSSTQVYGVLGLYSWTGIAEHLLPVTKEHRDKITGYEPTMNYGLTNPWAWNSWYIEWSNRFKTISDKKPESILYFNEKDFALVVPWVWNSWYKDRLNWQVEINENITRWVPWRQQ